MNLSAQLFTLHEAVAMSPDDRAALKAAMDKLDGNFSERTGRAAYIRETVLPLIARCEAKIKVTPTLF